MTTDNQMNQRIHDLFAVSDQILTSLTLLNTLVNSDSPSAGLLSLDVAKAEIDLALASLSNG